MLYGFRRGFVNALVNASAITDKTLIILNGPSEGEDYDLKVSINSPTVRRG
jgi:hypothetical protein